MLDFTAVEFVGNLDDISFLLGTVGFFGRAVKAETENPIYDENVLVSHPRHYRPRTAMVWTCGNVCKKLGDAVTRLALFWVNMALLAYIVVGQYDGRYLPETILIQMGDRGSSTLSTHSGLYNLFVPNWGVFEYREQAGDEDGDALVGGATFAWCQDARAWTLVTADDAECGDDWVLKSTELDVFAGMIDVADDPWYTLERSNIELEVEFIDIVSMIGVDTECDGINGDKMYGWACEFSEPCELIAVDALAGAFQDQRRRSWPTEFELFRDIFVYRQPVYIHRDSPERNADLVLFTGRQWAMLSTDAWTKEEDQILSDDDLRLILKDFRIYEFDRSL